MALLTKDKVNQFGVMEEYWRILRINIDAQYNFCDITLGGYKDQESRESFAEPMNIKKVRANWSEEEFMKFFAPRAIEDSTEVANIYNIAYNYVKYKDEYFSDAEDC